MRLAIVTTAGPVDSIAALAAGRAGLAIARTDETMPDGTMSVAIMRKNIVVLWAPTGPARRAQRKEGKSKIKSGAAFSLLVERLEKAATGGRQ